MRFRFIPVLFFFVVLAASCGVSRDAEVASDTEATSVPSGDDTDADGAGEGATDTTAPEPTAPPTTAADSEVAVTLVLADGTETDILHGDLNAIAGPTRDNDEFVTLAYGGQVPDGFEAVVLSQVVWERVLANELANAEGAVTEADRAEAKDLLFRDLSQILAATSSDPDADSERLYREVPYLPFIVELQATQIALSTLLAQANPAGSDPCVSHILVATEAEAQTVVADLAGGAAFADLAVERSTDTVSGAAGGALGCVPSTNYVPEFAAAVDGATLDQVVGPVQSEFGYHVLVVTGYRQDGAAQERLETGLTGATITVDNRIGSWDAEVQRIVPPES